MKLLRSIHLFFWYDQVTIINGGIVCPILVDDYLQTPLDEIINSITQKTKIIWLCNPNNPIGSIIPYKKLKSFIEKVPQNILIDIDEAYIDFASKYQNTVDFLKIFSNPWC